MGWGSTHHRLIVIKAALSALLVAAMLAGCTAAPAQTADSDLAARLNSALAGGEVAFAAQFSSPLTATSWYAVLSHAEASFTPDPTAASLVTVRTRLPGDRRGASEVLKVDLAADGTIRGTLDAGVRPIWALGRTELTSAAHGTLLSSDLTAAARRAWELRLDRASTAVSHAGILTTSNHWDGGLVVEIPADATGFTAITGSSAADISAVTTCSAGTPRIVINPASFTQTADWLQATLTHEAVHVATESPCSSGVAWVVEGVAESVAAHNDPATAKSNAKLVHAYLRSHHRPTALPTSLVTQTDYALAQLALDQVRAKLGTSAPAFIAAGISGKLSKAEVAKATGWYLAELKRRG